MRWVNSCMDKNMLFENRDRIAENIVLFMRSKGYSKMSLHKLTGISRPTIDKLLKGESPNPTELAKQITKLSDTFQLDLNVFLRDPANKTSSNVAVSYQYSDRAARHPGVERTQLTKELLQDLDNLLDIASLYY